MNPKDLVGAKKAPLRYVPPALNIAVSQVMEHGASKYGPFNWREQPVSAMTYIEAIFRHLYAWMDGQNSAEDSGLSHLAHAAAGLGILIDAEFNGSLLDDRATPGPAADMLRALDKSQPKGDMNGNIVPEAWGTGDGQVFSIRCDDPDCTWHAN